jgi:hypothetical protein
MNILAEKRGVKEGYGIADESGIPGRCFRESRRHPRAQSKRSSQNNGSK